MGQVLLGTGAIMIVASMIFAPLFLVSGSGAIRKKGTGVAPLTTRTGAVGAFDASASYPVADGWGDGGETGYSSRSSGYGEQDRYNDDYDDEDDRPGGLMRRRW
jgi:hypothetical protein